MLELLGVASQICHENINKPLDGANLAYFGIDIRPDYDNIEFRVNWLFSFNN